MSCKIEDYALIGDCHGAGLVSKAGSLDWLCVPRFDSPASFAALLGTEDHGRWLITPRGTITRSVRRYRPGTLILETELTTSEGTVRLIDFMPPHSKPVDVVRVVQGVSGRVPMHYELTIRFDYGSIVPWITRNGTSLNAIAGPDMLHVYSPVVPQGQGMSTVADFTVGEGQTVPFVITFHPSHLPEPTPVDPLDAVQKTEEWWLDWSRRSTYQGTYADAVQRSLITLKALTYAPTGGIVAAPTTSLPEQLGGVRNWDYRYCWVRDATITLYALMFAGYTEEASAWREWLLRAVAGSPSQLQIMYGIGGERRLTELELDWLPGYENSRPVRIGNGAHDQLQLDVYGELLDAMHMCRRIGMEAHESWDVETALLEFLESNWRVPDEGIWEIRGPRRQFTHSKVMAWVAFDRAIKAIETFKHDGPLERWRKIRTEIHDQVCSRGFNSTLDCFTQYYGSEDLDASLLMIPLVGFLPATDPRMLGTISAIERKLMHEGFVLRYDTSRRVDGLHGHEGAFLACSFWLVDNLVMCGRRADARELFERLLAIRNDVGLLSEEYDTRAKRLVGNFPQAFSHLALVNSAQLLSQGKASPEDRRDSRLPPSSMTLRPPPQS